jgi:predicted CXXCH cytochrome family protein
VTYRPGDDLAAHFTPTQDAAAVWPDGSARRNHQQYMDWSLGSRMAQAADTSCITCHRMHERGDAAQLRQPVNDLCLSCHSDQRALVRHTPFHEKAIRTQQNAGDPFLCTDCHMPKTASSAQLFDLHNHSLLQPDPQASVDHGGVAAMPNACNTCHTDRAESPQWANEIVAYAVAQTVPSASSFFGPGPTPTSPPPPTPIPSVGQRAEVDLRPPGLWLRWLIFGLAGLIALAFVVWLVNLVRPRRTFNA